MSHWGKRSTPADRIIQILTYNSFEKKNFLLEFRGFGNIFWGHIETFLRSSFVRNDWGEKNMTLIEFITRILS